MMTPTGESKKNVLPFEEALEKAGFGCYSYTLIALSGLIIISMGVIAFSISITIPTSACELNTTSAQQGLIAAAPVLGAIVGTLGWGYLADTRGRRKIMLFSLSLASTVNLITSISVNWVMFMIMQFLSTSMAMGQYPIAMSLLSESVPKHKRNFVILTVASIFLLSQGIMAALAIPIIPLTFSYHIPALGIYWNSWRTTIVIYSIPGFVALCWMFFMQESPKYAIVKGEEEWAIKILKTIYRINNKGKELEISGLILPEDDRNAPVSTKDQIRPLFRKPLLKPTMILTTLLIFQLNGPFMIWLPKISNQFTDIILAGEGGNLSLCQVIEQGSSTPLDPDATPCALNVTSLLLLLIVGALQSSCNVLISLTGMEEDLVINLLILFFVVIDKVGRRNMVMIVTFTCGLSGVLVNLVPNAIASAVLFVINLIGQISLGLYTAIAVAIVPTQLRAIAIAFAITADRLCTVASIQILNFLLENHCEVGFYVYSAIFASSALVASFLPDDRVKKPKEGKAPRMISSNL